MVLFSGARSLLVGLEQRCFRACRIEKQTGLHALAPQKRAIFCITIHFLATKSSKLYIFLKLTLKYSSAQISIVSSSEYWSAEMTTIDFSSLIKGMKPSMSLVSSSYVVCLLTTHFMKISSRSWILYLEHLCLNILAYLEYSHVSNILACFEYAKA